MKYIILFIFSIVLIPSVYAAPFRCDMAGGAVFADINQCDAVCAGETGQTSCEELEQASGVTSCDTGRYRGFVAVNGKTFAITNASVVWKSGNTAKIRNTYDNKIIAKLLKALGVQVAWIGAEDRKHSTAYNDVDPTRFVWRDGSNLAYSNWKQGEPNNAFDASSIGISSIYGEHWVVIDQSGNWSDVGLNADGTDRLLPAVVEWNGELSCVSGTEKTTVSDKPTGMVCGMEDDKPGFKFENCSEGNIFEGDKSFLCPIEQTACIRNENEIIVNEVKSTELAFPELKEYAVADPKPEGQLSPTHAPVTCNTNNGDMPRDYLEYSPVSYFLTLKNVGNGSVEIIIKPSQSMILPPDCFTSNPTLYYPDYTKTYNPYAEEEVVSSEFSYIFDSKRYSLKNGEQSSHYLRNCILNVLITGLHFTSTVRKKHTKIDYTCPQTGRPCIENGGSYSCSPHDCSDGSYGGNYTGNPNEVPEGANDENNNGLTDDDGNCLGKIVIFPGNDRRCRMVGLQSKGFQCCKIIDPKDADKSDVVLFPSVWEFNVCNGSERALAVQRAKDQCVSIGTYCAEKWKTGLCVQTKETFCCFDSDLSRAFNEAGKDLLNKSWGTPEKPNCGGFSPEELQALSAMNISDHPKMQQYAEKLGAEFSDKLMNEFEKNFKTPEFQENIENQVEGARK